MEDFLLNGSPELTMWFWFENNWTYQVVLSSGSCTSDGSRSVACLSESECPLKGTAVFTVSWHMRRRVRRRIRCSLRSDSLYQKPKEKKRCLMWFVCWSSRELAPSTARRGSAWRTSWSTRTSSRLLRSKKAAAAADGTEEELSRKSHTLVGGS